MSAVSGGAVTDAPETVVMSYGGGWQSVAMCVLVAEGRLPRPDLIGIADTGREIGSTWEYLHTVTQPYLARVGLAVEIVPHSLARVDLCNKSGLTLMPCYTKTEAGINLFGEMSYAEGRLAAFCSGEWKRDVMERWLRSKGVKRCEQWIGYSLDEVWRVKGDHRAWCRRRHPLIELRVTRKGCGEIIRAAGLPMPKKSRCYCCPHQTTEEWQEVRGRPDDFAAAVAVEDEVNRTDPDHGGELYLYSGRVPLALATFRDDAGPGVASRPCEAGGCWT